MMQYYSCPFVPYNISRMYAPQGPQQMMPQQMLPQQMMPQQMLPQEMMPQQMMPQEMMPQQMMPNQVLPQHMMPHINQMMMPGFDNIPVQEMPQMNMNMDMGMEDMDMDMMDMDMGPATARPGDPPPILSNNPPTTSITLFKELTGYANYGNPSGNADILYTGNRGTWTFQLPPSIAAGQGNLRGQILVRAVLDDHQDVSVNRYSATITVNNQTVHTGRVPLEHGRPAGTRFTNWQTLTFNVSNLRRTNRIVIVNTSTAGPNDWIAFDWMELRISTR